VDFLRIAIYPGTFDPLTNGHLDIIERVCKLGISDRLIIAVRENLRKSPLLSLVERLALIYKLTSDFDQVEVDICTGLLVEYARSKYASMIIRGLRNGMDFNYEMEMAVINQSLAPDIETLFIPSKAENIYVSSSAVKEITKLGGSAGSMAPAAVIEYLKTKL
jgi:pantetheine-phosphate adenylyltransferase